MTPLNLLNPYLWLGLIIWTAVVGGGSYLKGYKHAENSAKADHAKELAATIAQSREDAVIDMMAATEVEAERHKTSVRFKEKVVTVERMINANPDCRFPEPAVGLFTDAIREANAIAAGAKYEPVPPTPPIKGREPDRGGPKLSVYY